MSRCEEPRLFDLATGPVHCAPLKNEAASYTASIKYGCVTSRGLICRNQHDGTSHSWICCGRRSARCLRGWAPSVAKRRRFEEGNWRAPVLLGWQDSQLHLSGSPRLCGRLQSRCSHLSE
jgi:hypothetical protein